MTRLEIDQLWPTISQPILNRVKLYFLKQHVDAMLYYYGQKIAYVAKRYARSLPGFVAESEMDDLMTIAQLEFIETIKAWDPNRSDDIWPLAYTRIVGAMKDHIRYVTKSDPSRVYDWITDAAYTYMAVQSRADFRQTIETGIELNNAMACLSDREKRIVVSHIKNDLTFKQIGEEWEVSESQISRIYKQALAKIKKRIDV